MTTTACTIACVWFIEINLFCNTFVESLKVNENIASTYIIIKHRAV